MKERLKGLTIEVLYIANETLKKMKKKYNNHKLYKIAQMDTSKKIKIWFNEAKKCYYRNEYRMLKSWIETIEKESKNLKYPEEVDGKLRKLKKFYKEIKDV